MIEWFIGWLLVIVVWTFLIAKRIDIAMNKWILRCIALLTSPMLLVGLVTTVFGVLCVALGGFVFLVGYIYWGAETILHLHNYADRLHRLLPSARQILPRASAVSSSATSS